MTDSKKPERRGSRASRKYVCSLAAALIVLPYCAAATETNVVSVPCAVVRTEIAGANSALVGICLDLFDCGVNSFSNQLTGGENQEAADLIRKWDASAQSFTDAWKWTNGLFYSALPPGAASPLSFLPGDVAVIVSRHGPQTQSVFVAGSVLLDDVYTNQIAAASNLVAYPFSSAIKLNDTALTNLGHGAEQFEYADWLQAWNVSQTWDPVYALRSTDSQWRNTNDWSGSPTTDLLLLGRGYLYDNVSNSFAWIQGRSYSRDLFPANTNVPYVTAMTLNANKDEITLTIKCAGQPSSEKLEVYYKDSTGLDLFSSTGWLIAATNLSTSGQQSRTWADTGSVSRAKINTVYARYYAIGRGDIDSDQDGLPNGREILVHGTDPQKADTDGDGLLDSEEVDTFHTGPTLADSNTNGTNDMYLVPGQSRVGTNTCHRAGTWIDLWADASEEDLPPDMDPVHDWYQEVTSWVESGTTLYATNMARAEWEFTAPAADMYRFGFCHTNACAGSPPAGYQYRLHFLVDHVRVQTLYVPAVSTSVWQYVTTPWLTATNHNFRLVWVNWLDGQNTAFGVKEVGLFGVDASRTNTTGRQIWVDEILAQGNDTDEDGLTDLQEIDICGTDPLNPDTDGDHLLDGQEVALFGTDPTNSVADATLLVEHVGTDTVSRVDAEYWYWAWWQLDSSLVAKWKGGTLTYAMPLSTGGMYRVGLQLRAWDCEITDTWKFQVEVYVDDAYLSTLQIFADADFSNTGYANTTWLAAGSHTVTFKWVNSAWVYDPTLRDPNIQIEKVSLYEVHGADTNANGCQDWMEFQLSPTADTDGDGIADRTEVVSYGTSPYLLDTDGDGMPDGWEVQQGFNPLDPADAALDADGDHLTNLREFQHATDPRNPDTDGDGLWDGCEVDLTGSNPTKADSDGDGLLDWWACRFGLDPNATNSLAADLDGDGLTNGWEQALGINPLSADSDGDGLPDAWEIANGLNPGAGLTTSLVSWWRFDEPSGYYAMDDNKIWINDGIFIGDAQRYPLGYTGQCLLLDGDGDYALVSDHYSLCSTGGLTLTAWVNIQQFDDTNNPIYFVSKGNASGQAEYALSYVKATQSLRFSHKNLNNESETLSVTCNLTNDTWTHLAVAVSNATVSFYTNGVLCGVTQALSYARSNLGNLYIGSSPDSNAVHPGVHGLMDEVRVYSAALTAAQLSEFMEGELDADNDGLSNRMEFLYGTNPLVADTDGDGLSDGVEVYTYGTNPLVADTDGDGVSDYNEVNASPPTDPLKADHGTTGGPAIHVAAPQPASFILW